MERLASTPTPTASPVAALPHEGLLPVLWLAARAVLGFALLWLVFYGLFRAFPYLTAGADVVYEAKLRQEASGTIFPAAHPPQRIVIFGTSKVLAGFVPSEFDQLARENGGDVFSYNSGYPDRSTFVPQLQRMVDRGQLPDVILLTMPWGAAAQGRGDLFHLPLSDHELADRVFPFRHLVRDTLSFLVTSRAHGGVVRFYRESRENTARMLRDRGYYFIAEQSHYPNDSLPDDFHLETDQPHTAALRVADATSPELAQLNRIIEEHGIMCYYVPEYRRAGESAAPPAVDTAFASLLEQHSRCHLLGPDYFVYPNRMFSDAEHLNREGARVYTEAVFNLVSGRFVSAAWLGAGSGDTARARGN